MQTKANESISAQLLCFIFPSTIAGLRPVEIFATRPNRSGESSEDEGDHGTASILYGLQRKAILRHICNTEEVTAALLNMWKVSLGKVFYFLEVSSYSFKKKKKA
eukprot:g60880.t1